jgi:hypothetical protein
MSVIADFSSKHFFKDALIKTTNSIQQRSTDFEGYNYDKSKQVGKLVTILNNFVVSFNIGLKGNKYHIRIYSITNKLEKLAHLLDKI